jgi:GH15 family glucan-1,4-alpha-glucosidase
VLAEQFDPYSGAPMSVSPLTWSHATVVSTCVMYAEKYDQLSAKTSTGITQTKDNAKR